MSYGYQGPPTTQFKGQRPPTSFGAPPGAPSAPNALPFTNSSNIGFNNPPNSFGMPQPARGSPIPQQQGYSSYQSASFPNQNRAVNQCPYPQQTSYQPQSSPYPPQSSPYPPQNSPYPSQTSPYPPQSSPYPPQSSPHPPQNSPYPPQNSPHPPQNSPYPPQNSPYPPQNPQQSPYPHQTCAYSPQTSPYPPQIPQESPYPSLNPHPGPQASPYYANPNFPSSNNSRTPGGIYPGGQGADRGLHPLYGASKTSVLPYQNYPAPRTAHFKRKLSPTVVPYDGFDARADAEVLRKAMKGFGTDEKSIINVLANRSNLQRQEIAVQFKTLYGKDLIKDLKSEMSGNFENLLIAMMTPLPQYYAKELHEAMSGIGTDECVLIEVLCTMSNHEVRIIKQAYECMFGRTLEDDLRADTSGNFKRLMVSLCCANRDESFDVDPSAAIQDAKSLLQAGELCFGTDESVFNSILVQRNVPQLHQIFLEYENITGHGMEQAIENEFSGDIKKGLLAIVKCVKNRGGFFAEQLYKSMKGLGTEDSRLIRLVVTRCETDMGEIKEAFMQQYGQSLENFISDDCTGHYKKCLLAIVS